MNLTPEQYVYTFLVCPVAAFACIPITLSIIVLSHIKDSPLFAYLKLEVFFILLDCAMITLVPITICEKKCFPNLSPLFECVINYFPLNFFSGSFEMCSILMSIVASLMCLLMFNNSMSNSKLTTFLMRLNPNLTALIGFSLCLLLFAYQIPVFVAKLTAASYNESTFTCDWLDDLSTPPTNVFLAVSIIISNGILVFILILVNVFMLVRIRRNLNNSKSMITQNSAAHRRDVEQKLTKLILIDCVNLVTGRIPTMCYFVLNIFIDLTNVTSPFLSIITLFTLLSFYLKFFIYYKLNSKFKSETDRILSKITKFVYLCRI